MDAETLRNAALVSKAWPYEEARKLLKRYPDGPPDGRAIVFETGYGPSGLPHLGTFQEVARTSMVRHALTELTGWPSRLIAFSDDMDGMRKVPPGVPHQDMMHAHLDQPLSRVPDPFGCGHDSYAAHNNNMLRDFLDRFGFDYEFLASSDCYDSGRFDEVLRGVLRNYAAIMDIMLPTLREERRQSYSPVLPISAVNGAVLQVPTEVVDAEAGLIRFIDPNGRRDRAIACSAARPNCSGRSTGRRAGSRSGSITKCRARTRSTGSSRAARSRAPSAAARPTASTTSCSSTRMARRSARPRAMASPSTNG